ncbi:MAG: glycosyltransferase family 4 protein [Desulfurococcaceae archaeon]
MKVLLISGEYPPYMFGGGATFMYYLSRGLADKGVDVTVVSMRFSKRFSRDVEVEEPNSRLRVLRVAVPVYMYPRHDVFQLVARPLISELVKEHDVVHLNTGLYYPFLRDIVKKSGKPAIVTIHGDSILVYKLLLNLHLSPSETMYGLLHMGESHIALKKELKELHPVFVSKSLYETMRSKYEFHRHSIIYNGVDFNYIDKAVNSKPKTRFYEVVAEAKERGYKVLMYPARLHPIKNHSTLIKILRFLIKKYDPKILLVFTSDGVSRQSIIRLAKSLKVSRNILMTGKLPYDEMLRILDLADAVPYISLYEAHPLVLIEALYLGKPIITFNLPYVGEVIDICTSLGVSCYIESVDSTRRFIEGLCTILTNGVLNNKRRIFIERFSMDYIADAYIKLYEGEQIFGNVS